MSLVNDMLKDLDRRQAADKDVPVLAAGYGALTGAKRRSSWLLPVLMAVALLLAVLIAALWYFKDSLLPGSNQAVSGEQNMPAREGEIVRAKDESALSEVLPSKTPVDQTSPSVTADAGVSVSSETVPEQAMPSVNVSAKEVAQTVEVEPTVEDKRLSSVGSTDDQAPVQTTDNQNHTRTALPVETARLESSVSPAPPKAKSKPASEAKTKAAQVEKKVVKTPEQIDAGVVTEATKMLEEGSLSESKLDKVEAMLEAQVRTATFHDGSSEMLMLLHLQRNKPEKAKALLKLYPVNDAGLQLKMQARIAFQSGDVEQAISLLSSNVPKVQEDSDFHALLAAYYQQAGRFEEAVSVYAGLVSYDDRVGSWWAGLGISLEGASQSDAALRAYQRALAADNSNLELVQYIEGRVVALSKADAVGR